MTIYGKEKFAAKNRDDVRLGEETGLRDGIEEEPSELDVVSDELSVEGLAEEEDQDQEAAGPLAEDAPPTEDDDSEDLEEGPGVRTSGGDDVTGMSRADRQREFPSVRKRAKAPSRRRRRPSSPADRRRG